ncbi:hypothetical protein BGZ47_007059 [Haplosporangium gracile]|nr:hypothetical protein BGZ47_007059 [Haplosporangium gracile]
MEPDGLSDMNSKIDDTRLSFPCLETIETDIFRGQVLAVLKIVAKILQQLGMDDINGLQGNESFENTDLVTEDLSTLSPLQSDEDEGSDNNSSTKLVLPGLETLALDYTSTINLFITQFVKCYPRLKALDLYLDTRTDTVRLVDNLRTHCQDLQHLALSPARTFHHVEGLIRHSSAFRLCTLHVEISGLDNDLFSAISQHAGTLGDLEVDRHTGDMDICGVFQVVAAFNVWNPTRF